MAGLGITVDFEAKLSGLENDIKKINNSFNKFDSNVKNASESVSRSFKSMESSAQSFGNIAKTIAGGIGFSLIAKDILDTNRSMEALRAQLKAIEGSGRGAERTFKFISDFAVNTPFEIQGLTETYIKLQNFGIEPTQKVMQALTDQAAKLGGSQETLSGITLALGQAYSKGKLQAEEMNQLIERGVPVYKLLAEVTGESTAAIQEMAKDGKISADIIDQFIEKMGQLASGSNIAAMDTLNGKISNLSDSWHRFQDLLLNDKSEGIIKTIVSGAGVALDALSSKLDNSLEARIAEATEKLRELESFRANSTVGFVGNAVTDQRIQEQGKLLAMLREQKRQQDINDNSAKAVADTWKWVDEAEVKTKAIAKHIDEAGKKAKTLEFNSDQLAKSEKIISRLQQSLQLTREQASGVVGNLFQESNLKTSAISGDGFGSVGIAQWTDRGNSFRKTALEAYAKSVNKLPTDIEAQIGFLELELNTTERKALDRLRKTSGITDATISFRQSYERPDPAQANDQRRIAAANTAFLGGLTESEVKTAESLNAQALKQAEDFKIKYAAIFQGLRQDVENSRLPEIQLQIQQETSQALQQLGLDTDTLTQAQLRQKSAIEEAVKSKYFDLEVTKLQQAQAEQQVGTLDKVMAAYTELDDVLNSVIDNTEFNRQLAIWDDLLKKNAISADQFKSAMDRISVEFNKSAKVIEASTSEMSTFAEQAARNMQDSFADFLFDPFKGGVSGMVENFATALQRMAANAAAQQIFDALGIQDKLKSGFGSGAGGFSGLAGFFGGSSGATGNPFNGSGPLMSFQNSSGSAIQSGLSGIGNFFGDLFKGIASFDVGTDYVPKTGLALIHEGEKIIPAKDNKTGMSGGGSQVVNINQSITVGSGADRNMVKEATAQGLRNALGAVNSAQRYR